MSDPMQEPLSKYSKIIGQLEELARKHGLYIQGAAVMPPRDEDGPVFIQATFLVGEVAVDAVPEEGDPDLLAQFNDIISGSDKAAEEQSVEQIRRDYESGKGIFGDLDDE